MQNWTHLLLGGSGAEAQTAGFMTTHGNTPCEFFQIIWVSRNHEMKGQTGLLRTETECRKHVTVQDESTSQGIVPLVEMALSDDGEDGG